MNTKSDKQDYQKSIINQQNKYKANNIPKVHRHRLSAFRIIGFFKNIWGIFEFYGFTDGILFVNITI